MKLAKALARRVHPMMLVVTFGLLGIGPALTLMFVAFSLVVLAGWLGGELAKHLRVELDGVDGGPTRW